MKSTKAIRVINRFFIVLIFIPAISSGQGTQDFGTSQSGRHEIASERVEEISAQKEKLQEEEIRIKEYDGSTQIRARKYSKIAVDEKSLLKKETKEISRLIKEIQKDLNTSFPEDLNFRISSIKKIDDQYSDGLYQVYFYQYIDGIRAWVSEFKIDSAFNIEDVALALFDPDHPNTNQTLWMPKERAREIAIQEMRENFSSGQQAIGFDPDKVVDDAIIYMPAGSEQEGTTLKPVYIFLYEDFDFQVIVDALTGEPEFRETSFRAHDETNTVTCVARATVPITIDS